MDDLIRRQDAIDAICTGSLSAATVYGRTDKGMAALKETVKLIKELPSVTSAPKIGRWIEYEDNTSFVRQIPRSWLECSECEWSCDLGYKNRYDYCPNCGAKMEAENG